MEREAATARLRVIGARAVEHLLAALEGVSPSQRRLILPVLEDLPDSRVLPAVLPLARDPETSMAALTVVRQHLVGATESRRLSTVDALGVIATDKDLPLSARSLAAELLAGPLAKTPALPATKGRAGQQSPSVGDEGGTTARGAAEPRAAEPRAAARLVLDEALAGRLPPSPDELRAALAREGEACSVAELQDLLGEIGQVERKTRDQIALEWAGVRAAVHVLLAARESRLGVADLRETIERWHDRLPMGFVVAIGEVGDADCLEAVAAAYERAESEWVREQMVSAFRQVMRRHALTRRHAAVKRAERRSKALAERL